jgi:ATP-dependent Lhr-like helicase
MILRVSVFGSFAPRLQQAIVARLGWSRLRPVQELAGAALLAGNNAVILAPTAGGKTEACMFPALSQLIQQQSEGVGVLYVAPIKALLNNQSERLGLYTEMVGLSCFVWHGDTSTSERRRFVRDPSEVLMTTPESLEVMLISPTIDAARLFAALRMVIVDEVHALAGSDRGGHLLSVIERLARLSRHDLQRVGLSATVGNPEAISAWLQGSSRRERVVIDPPHESSKRALLIVHEPDLDRLAAHAATLAKGGKSLLFCQSRAITEAVAEPMRRAGIEVFVHHSSVSREERELAEQRFAHGRDACIVCTSTLELGIDVGDLDRVIQADAPDRVGSFLQRMGRTGRRAGQTANTTFLCETEEGVLQAAALIELARAGWVEPVELSTRAWPVLVHQLLALALAHEGVSVEQAWQELGALPDLSGIHRAEFERLIAWMLRDASLRMASARLVLGPKAERRFGRRNFMDLYAVFSSPQSYAVETTQGQSLGSLNQGFVDRLVAGVSCFLLSGRAWAVVAIHHDTRRVLVQVAPLGRKPTWGGYLPHFLGFEVCQQVLALLCDSSEPAYLHASARAVLAGKREGFAGVLAPGRGGVEVGVDEIRWWTFAGGRINSTLRFALEAIEPSCKVVPDNYVLRVRGGLELDRFRAAIARLHEQDTWEDQSLWERVGELLPAYRLSKFQVLMPPWVEREMVAAYLLDVAGAWHWLTGRTSTLARVPASAHTPALATPDIERKLDDDSPPTRTPRLPVLLVRDDAALADVCARLRCEDALALDVETTLGSRTLCLVQLATREHIYILDPLELSSLDPLLRLLADPDVVKVIHNASFERQVLRRQGGQLVNVVDTLALSRARHGTVEGGHSLAAVCRRELGIELDKREQTSDWMRRPLSDRQLAYAAMDVEVLLPLWDQLEWQGRLL